MTYYSIPDLLNDHMHINMYASTDTTNDDFEQFYKDNFVPPEKYNHSFTKEEFEKQFFEALINLQVIGNPLMSVWKGGTEKVKCPHPECYIVTTVQRLIIELNDRHEWSRNEIADWLETLDVDINVDGA